MTGEAPAFPPGEATLRDDARAILLAGVEAADPDALVAEALRDAGPDTGVPGRFVLLAGGKAAPAMARGAARALGDAIASGVIVGPPDGRDPELSGVRFFRGGHPLPTEEGLAGARALLDAARRAGPDEGIVFLLSGGGSAILALPPEGVSVEDVRRVTRLLLETGAPIEELNAVRKHLDLLKGGGLARAVAEASHGSGATRTDGMAGATRAEGRTGPGSARLTALVLSDVVGDRLDVIASGPVSPDPSTWADAVRVCEDRGIWEEVPLSVRTRLRDGVAGRIPDTPGADDPAFRSVEAEIVGSAANAAEGARQEAARRGYRVSLLTTTLEGEAREAGSLLATTARRIREEDEPVSPPGCVLSAGETTVTVRGDGRGGRNQEVALGAALELDGMEGALVASLGTDGVDGPTDAAGALATGSTVRRALEAGLDPADALDRNDAYPLFETLGDLLVTGPTGTNVMDLQVVLVAEGDGP